MMNRLDLGPLSLMAREYFGDGESSESKSFSRPSTSATFVTARSSLEGTTPRDTFAVPSAAALVPILVDSLADADVETLASSIMQIALLLDSADGEDAAALGAALRRGPGLARLVALVEHADARVHQSALLVIGNLAAHEVDYAADATQQELKNLSAFELFLPHVQSATPLTVAYALGAIRNTCTSSEEVSLMQDTGVLARLNALATGEVPEGQALAGQPSSELLDHPRLRAYAAGCLVNVRQIMGGLVDAGPSSS